MTTIPDLIAEAMSYVEVTNPEYYENHLVRSLADALEDQQKTLDAETAAHDDTLREWGRYSAAIREVLGELGDPDGTGPWLSGNIPNNVRRILATALEGSKGDG